MALMNKTIINNCFWIAVGLPPPESEHRFHETRRWRIDYAWPDVKLAVEIEGGIFTKGRHTRASGFLGDIEKYNSLTENGWSLLRYPPSKVDFIQIKDVYKMLNSRVKIIKELL